MPSTTNAQAFEQGKSQISIGYWFDNATQALLSNYDQNLYPNLEFSALGPMFLNYEFGAAQKIGFGLNVAYAGAVLHVMMVQVQEQVQQHEIGGV